MELAQSRTSDRKNFNNLNRDQLILEYLPYVKRIVHRIAIHLPPNVETEDLMNVGVIGLIQAIDRYDPSRDNKFTTYAAFRIRGAVLSELRSRDFLSRSNRRKIRELERTYLQLEQKLGRDVEDAEVAEALDLSLDQLYRIKQISSISFISYEELGYTSNNDKEKLVSSLVRDDGDDVLTRTGFKQLKAAIAEAIEELPEKEKLVLSLYYMDELTMKETGEVLGVTESRVSQLHSQAIIRLRSKLRKRKLIEQ
jgi:RNA polymerase sigma factor for flagellar operon FliA